MAPSDPSLTPFSGPLWERARQYLANDVRGTGGNGEAVALSGEEVNDLLATAAADGVDANERALLRILFDTSNIAALAEGLQTTSFDPSGVAFRHDAGVEADADSWIGRAEAGTGVGMREATVSEADRARLRETAAGTPIGPGLAMDLSTQDGRVAILDRLSQNMQDPILGRMSCVGTSITALAVARGPVGVLALARAVAGPDFCARSREPGTIPITMAEELVQRLERGDTTMTMAELATLAEELYQTLNVSEADAGNGGSGLYSSTDQAFLNANPDLARQLFANGSGMLTVDTNGDTIVNHRVADIRMDDGTRFIFDPWDQTSGHHAIDDPDAIALYERASQARAGFDGHAVQVTVM